MSTPKIEYNPKGMPFRRLGPSGLRVPVLSLGGWLTLGGTVKGDPVKDIIRTAFEGGINYFDTAEEYSGGRSEIEMGRVIKELGLRRTDLIISTKIFFGVGRKGPNDGGLSRKHIIEGLKESLQRLQLDYVDIVFAHRPDVNVSVEETVRAFNWVIDQGWAFYWGTSEWSAQEIEEAHQVATRLHLIGPVAEQCQHNMFHRERPEKEYAQLYKKYGFGVTAYSPLARGVLTGKYNDGIPQNSRFTTNAGFFAKHIKALQEPQGKAEIEKVRQLTKIADELQCTPTHLALAWLIANPNTSTVILGASTPEQVTDNLKALAVVEKLTAEVLEKIEAILANKPRPLPLNSRPRLDRFGRDSKL